MLCWVLFEYNVVLMTVSFTYIVEQWGEDGYFRMKRGCDSLAIESMAVRFDIIGHDIPSNKASTLGAM